MSQVERELLQPTQVHLDRRVTHRVHRLLDLADRPKPPDERLLHALRGLVVCLAPELGPART